MGVHVIVMVSDTISAYGIFRCNTFYFLLKRFHSNVGYLHVQHTTFVLYTFIVRCSLFVVCCKFLRIENQIRILFHRNSGKNIQFIRIQQIEWLSKAALAAINNSFKILSHFQFVIVLQFFVEFRSYLFFSFFFWFPKSFVYHHFIAFRFIFLREICWLIFIIFIMFSFIRRTWAIFSFLFEFQSSTSNRWHSLIIFDFRSLFQSNKVIHTHTIFPLNLNFGTNALNK